MPRPQGNKEGRHRVKGLATSQAIRFIAPLSGLIAAPPAKPSLRDAFPNHPPPIVNRLRGSNVPVRLNFAAE